MTTLTKSSIDLLVKQGSLYINDPDIVQDGEKTYILTVAGGENDSNIEKSVYRK
jgi:hypothetical protein